jgi:putative sterol carrier protein
MKLLNGTLNVTYALATMGIKVQGDKRLAMKLQKLANNRQPLKAKL